jgi:hypothetical protein
MTDDPLRDLFGAQAPNADPLADLFGSEPNRDFATGIQPKAPGRLTSALEGKSAAETQAETARTREIRDVAHNTPSEPPEGFGEYVTDKARSAAAGAVSTVGMGLRGLGAEGQRIHDVLGSVVGADNADAFLNHWLAPGSPLNLVPGVGALSVIGPSGNSRTLQSAGQKVQDVSDTINVSPEKQQQVGNIIANATGQVAGLIGLGLVGGEGVVDNAILGQSFDQMDQALKEKGGKTDSVAGLTATSAGGLVMSALERTGLDAIIEGLPIPIKNRIIRGFVDTTLVGGYEASEEVMQQVVQNFATKLGIDPNTPVRDWPKQIGEGILPNAEGGFGAGFIARAVLGKWGAHRAVTTTKPLGMREAGALAPDITPEDEASPLPTDLIVQGKMTAGAAAGTSKANQVLRATGMPDVGTRVDVSHNGRTQQGAVADAWTVSVGGQDSVGVKIKLDDGTMIEEPIATLHDMGVIVTPVALPDGLPEQDLSNPVVQQFAGEGMRTVEAAGDQGAPFVAPVGGNTEGKPGKIPGDQASKANIPQDVVSELVKAGIPEHVARGVAAGVVAESGNREGVVNDKSGATGLGQWLGSRKQGLIDRYGPNPTRAQQIEYLIHELKGGDAGGKSVLAARDEDEALQSYITDFMRPAKGKETTGDLERGRAALGSRPGTQGDLLGGPERTGTEMDAQRAVEAAAADEETDHERLVDSAHDILHADEQKDDAYVSHGARTLASLLGTTIPQEEATTYARAVLDRLAPDEAKRSEIAEQADQVAAPTEAQKEAGNYRKGHISLHGLDITIETPKDGIRSGTAPNGEKWSVRMPDHYGYVKRTTGADGEQVDVYVGPRPESDRVFVIDQHEAESGKFDEHKAMLGYDSAAAATKAYDAAFDDGKGPQRRAHIREMSAAEFKDWLGQEQTRPVAETTSDAGTSESSTTIVKDGFSTPQQAGLWIKSNKLQTGRYQVEDDQQGSYRVIDTQASKLSARPELGPTFGDPQGETGEAAVLRAISEGRHSTKDPLTGNWKWALREGYALEGKSGRLQLTYNGKQHLAALDEKSGRAEADHERANATSATESEKPAEASTKPTTPKQDALQTKMRRSAPGAGEDSGTDAVSNDHASVNEAPTDRVAVVAGLLGDVAEREAIRVQGFEKLDVDRQRRVLSQVVDRLHDNEVLRAIVETVPVSVMDMLVGRKLTTEDFLHNPAMLRSALTVPLGVAVPLPAIRFIDAIAAAGNPVAGNAAISGAAGQNEAPHTPKADTALSAGESEARHEPGIAHTRPDGYGSKNKIVTRDAYEDVRAKLKAKLRSAQVNSGVDPELLALGTQAAIYHIEAGARRFADFAKAVAEDLGSTLSELKPYLRSWYLGAQAALEDSGEDVSDMDGPGAVRAALSMIADSGKEEADNADQGTAPEGSSRSQPATVQPTEQERTAGRVGPGEAQPGERDLRSTDSGRGEATERGSEGPGSEAGRRGAGEGSRDGRPHGRGATGATGENYVIRPGALEEARGPKQKARDNLEAIRIVKRLASEDRFATPDEQEQIARYVGWGGLKNVFPDPITGAYGKGFEDIGGELAELLTPEEYETARRSIQYAHFTAEKVVREMWRAAERLGFDGGAIFEPGMGTGNFPGMMPDSLHGAAHYQGVEMDGITAAIAKALYPKHGVVQADFTAFEAGKDAYRLVIGNPPFSETIVKADPAYRQLGFVLHDYFFAKSLDAVQPGGALLFVTSAGTMNKMGSAAREYMAERAWLAGAIRLAEHRLCRERRDRGYDRHRRPGQEGAGRRAAGMGRTGFVD